MSRHVPNEDLTWREVYARGYQEAEASGLQPWQAREEASRAAWADYEARTGQPALIRNGPATMLDQILDRVVYGQHEVTFDTEGYSREQVDRIIKTAEARGLDAASDGRFVLVRDLREPAGHIRNPPLWESDDEAEYMRLLDRYDAEMARFMELEDRGDEARAAIHRRAAEAAERAADRLAKRYAANGGGYYVWALARGADEPLAEGPWGPYDTLDGAKTFARIGATEGAHDRAVSLGLHPQAPGFRIVRRYAAGSGERIL